MSFTAVQFCVEVLCFTTHLLFIITTHHSNVYMVPVCVFARALDLILDGGRGLSIAIAIFRNLDLECDPLEFGVRILILRPIFSFRVAACVCVCFKARFCLRILLGG